MKLTKFAMVVTGLFILAVTPAWANFLVNVKVSCSFVDDLNGQQKLGKTVVTKDELIQHFLDIAGSTLKLSDVELTYDSDFRRFHLINKANEQEVILIGTSQCIDAKNEKGVTTKQDSTCILTIDEDGPGGGISGTALGTEKSTDVFPVGGQEKFTFKASYKGHFITTDGNNICTIQFVSGQLF